MNLWLTLFAFGVPLSLFLLSFIVGCIETSPVRMFSAADRGPWGPYMTDVVSQAEAAGFTRVADGRHTKYGDKLPAVLLVSPDRSTLAIVAAGTIAGLPAKKTILLSQLSTGAVLLTTDDAGTWETDPLTRRQIVRKGSLGELLAEHRQGLESAGHARPFPPGADWSTVDQVYGERTARAVQRGVLRYTDATRQHTRKTIVGSFRASIVHGLAQSLRPRNIAREFMGKGR